MSKQPSRAGKAKPGAKDTKGKPNQSEKQLSSLFEIVPGKFNENDWNNMLEVDDSQEFIWELIDEIFDNTIKIIYTDYIEKKTIPYTINEARKAILHIIDWQFVNKETTSDLKEQWAQDEEPDSCVIDSWAQGYVQSVLIENREKQNYEEFRNETLGLMEELNRIVEEPQKQLSQINLENNSNKNSTNEKVSEQQQPTINKNADSNDDNKNLNKSLNATNKQKTKPKPPKKEIKIEEPIEEIDILAKLPKQKVVSNEKKKLDESISKAPSACQSVLKTLLNRPPNLREIELDSNGNIETILKLDFDKLPANNVKTKFSILNDEKNGVSASDFKKSKSNFIDSNNQIEKIRNSSNDLDHEITLEPAAGVIFTLMNSTRAGPKKTNITSKQQIILEKSESYLRPIRSFDRTDLDNLDSSIKTILGDVNLKESSGKYPNKLKTIPPISHNNNNTPSSTTTVN